MEVDSDNGLLGRLAAGGEIESGAWVSLRDEMIEQLQRVAHNDFPIPNLPPPHDPRTRLLSPLPSSPLERTSSQEADKENAPSERRAPPATSAPAVQHLEPGELPKQISTMLEGIVAHLKTFTTHPPHTIQRLSELILKPRAHYNALAPYLHAVDRVVTVTSSTDVYPLPPAIPDMSTITINGEEVKDPAAAVAWANPTNSSAAADEALGGALLTPIPWLNRASPESNGDSNSGSGAQIHSESTETISGPNGMGSIETVSVSVNGVPSTGHARGVTQGELLRQEQRAGVVPVSQLSRSHDSGEAVARNGQGDEEFDDEEGGGGHEGEEEEEETPHARGPDEIGAGDIGPQSASTSFVGEGGMDSHDIDVEAAVGRKHDEEAAPTASGDEAMKDTIESPEGKDKGAGKAAEEEDDAASEASHTLSSVSSATKRGPEMEMETGAAKKLKEEAEGEGDKMDTDKAGE